MAHQRKNKQGSDEEPKETKESSPSAKTEDGSMFGHLLGFEVADLCSWPAIVKLLSRPTDPSSLGIARILFGFLMALDIPQERGLSHADYKWGDPEECRFPLFNFLAPLPLQWMYMVYLVMFVGAIGIMLGLLFRLSCVMFMIPYWYLFLLDKTSWNNHSYLYGLCSILLLLSSANRYCSLDSLIWPKLRNAHVPLFNYTLFRTQFFLVYFIAGLKKLDMDWVAGYSMQKLSHHWVFSPFTYMLTNDEIDLWIVHRGGLFIDLFMGYFLFFDKTRILGMLVVLSFHGMNSQIFSIGMFPWVMMATTPLFCHVDWPKKLLRYLPTRVSWFLPSCEDPKTSSTCLYPKHIVKPEEETKEERKVVSPEPLQERPRRSHQVTALVAILYLMTQCFLPYSHFVTKGYNNWTNGLYGYSWDMMIHSWRTQHIRITYVNKENGDVGYLNPEAWTRGSLRWSSHSDMVKQYATCIQTRLQTYNISEVELYFDVWRSLNDRFQQRMFDPRVDIVTAPWHPLLATPWLMPLLADLSDWRGKLDEIEKSVYNSTAHFDVAFIADFPGLILENYVQPDLGNTTLHIMKGAVTVELVDQTSKNISLKEEEVHKMPPGEYHNVHTVSDSPSCYMYKFVNTSEVQLHQNISKFEMAKALYEDSIEQKNATGLITDDNTVPDDSTAPEPVDEPKDPETENPELAKVYQQIQEKRLQVEKKANMSTFEKFGKFMKTKYKHLVRGVSMTKVAILSIATGEDFEAVFNSTIGPELEASDFEEEE